MQAFTLFRLLYKTGFPVVIVHHRVRPLGNFSLNMELLRCSIEICWPCRALPNRFQRWRGATHVKKCRLVPVKEAAMELRTRLNVLAAIVSFAFLTAVVFGMF